MVDNSRALNIGQQNWETEPEYEQFPFTFDEYSITANSTAVYPNQGGLLGLAYATLGLSGEVGEVSEKIKKFIRDRGTDKEITEKALSDFLLHELGDVLWYINAICKEVGLTLENVAVANNIKLLSRQQRGKLHGSGDNR